MMSDCPKCWNTPCNCGYESVNSKDIRSLEARVQRLEDSSEELLKALLKFTA